MDRCSVFSSASDRRCTLDRGDEHGLGYGRNWRYPGGGVSEDSCQRLILTVIPQLSLPPAYRSFTFLKEILADAPHRAATNNTNSPPLRISVCLRPDTYYLDSLQSAPNGSWCFFVACPPSPQSVGAVPKTFRPTLRAN
jgi:hypothetical protein